LPGSPAGMGENSGMPPEDRTVLIVEDSENNASTLEIALSGIPHLSVLWASSAAEALRILTTHNPAVDAVITDLNMPRMDGIEMIHQIRGNAQLKATPIIVVSADTRPDTPDILEWLGVAAFFPKPYSPAKVRHKLEQVLNATT